jgi:hypothetical protein
MRYCAVCVVLMHIATSTPVSLLTWERCLSVSSKLQKLNTIAARLIEQSNMRVIHSKWTCLSQTNM